MSVQFTRSVVLNADLLINMKQETGLREMARFTTDRYPDMVKTAKKTEKIISEIDTRYSGCRLM